MTRGEAIQVLQTALTAPFIYGAYADALDMAIEALSADVVQGEWIKSKSAKGYVVCSNCNKLTTNINRKRYNYCPFCGARMKGASHETNKR